MLIGIIIALILGFAAGYYMAGKGNAEPLKPKRIEEYPFYPFVTNAQGMVEFSQPLFNEAVNHLLQNKNPYAARQLIIIGEQNVVRDKLATEDLNAYLRIYNKYEGDRLISENDQFMENYKRIVTLFGKSFKGTGFEILLHNLVNPTKSVVAIENGEVTGRKIENGTTNLLLDLKTRKIHDQDKLNYQLEIGSRIFKCTTVPIFRRHYGLVGAICINVDENFIRHEVVSQKAKLDAFINNFLRTDMKLDENILSPEEYQAALAGKRHYADDVLLRQSGPASNKRLLAILFSDVVGYSAIMGKNEKEALEILEENRGYHKLFVQQHHGSILKEIGDGILASFHAATDAVQCGIDIQRRVAESNRYQLRIGIHLGEVHTNEKDIFGDGVNIASRIQSVARPGTVAFSEVVYNNVRNKFSGEIVSEGEKQLKNIEEPVKVFSAMVERVI